MSFDINILVNGSRCKLYNHRGKTFVEAKEGSEYVIEIKNNSWDKILAVVSVDGLNVVDGEPAEDNGTGYVLDKYSSQKLYGFQYSNEKIATFKFGAMGEVKIDPKTGKPEIDPATGKTIPLGYAASKRDGSEKNTGVIGVRIWDEIPQPTPPPQPIGTGLYGLGKYGYDVLTSVTSTSSYSFQTTYSPNPQTWIKGNLLQEAIQDAKTVRQTALSHGTLTSNTCDLKNMVEDHYTPVRGITAHNACTGNMSTQTMANSIMYCSQDSIPETKLDMALFDMETQWGESKSYKIKEITFQRKNLVHSFDVYYTSRESLIAMGVDLGTEKRVSFPESFKSSKFAKPPKGWKA